MLSTMQDVPLTVTRILTHGSTIHGEVAGHHLDRRGRAAAPHLRRDRRPRGAARPTPCATTSESTGDDRVATLMWNNAEHVEAYFAIPSMGAVLHTLNLRLPAEQLAWIVNHAADRVSSSTARCCRCSRRCSRSCRRSSTWWSPAPATAPLLDGVARPGARVRGADRRAVRPRYDWPELDERTGRGHVLHLRHHRRPQGRGLLPPLDLPALHAGQHGRSRWA